MNGGTISWNCRKQDLLTLSSTEAEYVGLSKLSKELIWLKRLGAVFDLKAKATTVVFTDNQSCIKIVPDHKFSNRTKHIDTRFHHIKDLVEKSEVELKFFPTNENIADMFTKPLEAIKLDKFRRSAHLEGEFKRDHS